ncbi:unnamed protein product [Mytilus coruscus]|uniref:Integrase zinc-binding domain-containing protein n=1 Tax=Mytilus coruscus TaxID=42192 RepID=A0A6J8E5R5_MYTCO|nr:unnamed protein product [Mytilus coruscus]
MRYVESLQRRQSLCQEKSKMLIPVIIENAEHLGPLGYVDKTQKKETEHNITRGILDPHQEDIRVQLINFREEPNTVHAKEQIGVCESYYEMPAVGVCNHIGTEGTSSDKLPSHIEDLYNRSIVHLQGKEKQQLKELLQAYSDVFAKSADDLGRTNRVQHRINTGTAPPIRQAPRRLPLGKREIEKKEIVKMTDNAAVSWLQSLKDPTGQVARWLQTLGTYNFKVTHRAGRKHTNADAMSRNPCKSCKHQEDLNQAENFQAREKQLNTLLHPSLKQMKPQISRTLKNRANSRNDQSCYKEQQNAIKDNEALLGGWDLSEIRQQQLEDEDIGKIFAAFESGPQKPPWESISSGTSALKTLWGQWDRLEMHGGVLYRRFETNIGQAARKQMIVPKSRTQELLHYFHDVPSAAHLGIDKTLEKLKNGFYWLT